VFMCIMPSPVLIDRPPESNVMPLPTSTTVVLAPGGVYSMRMSRGGCSDPLLTPTSPPSFSRSMACWSSTVTLTPALSPADVAWPAAFTNAAPARRRTSASTSPAAPRPTATTVLPSLASSATASPTLPSNPWRLRNVRSSWMPADAAGLRPANTGTPTAWALPGTWPAGEVVKLMAIWLGLLARTAQQRVALLLPAAHGPQQAGKAVQVRHHVRALGRHAQ